MSSDPIRFEDGAAYERMMGVWSRLVGDVFLDWLAPEPGQAWLDVGCGNGAFTELLVARCKPVRILGVDPSSAQLSFARQRHNAGIATFETGDAMALPCDDQSFDAAVMALVIFFVPDPATGVREMVRATRPGGLVTAYAWDVLEPDGFPLYPMQAELRALGIEPVLPPRADASRIAALHALWADAGLSNIATRDITVARSFVDFDDLCVSMQIGLGMSSATRDLDAVRLEMLKERIRRRLPPDATGRITFTARANAVKGYVPG